MRSERHQGHSFIIQTLKLRAALGPVGVQGDQRPPPASHRLAPRHQLPQRHRVSLPLMGQAGQDIRELPALPGKQPPEEQVNKIRILHQHRPGDMGGEDIPGDVPLDRKSVV